MEFLRHDELSAKVTLIVVYSDFYEVVFPANILKNIAISSVFTTHYIMIEDTMVPSGISRFAFVYWFIDSLIHWLVHWLVYLFIYWMIEWSDFFENSPLDLLYDKLRKIPVSVLYEPINLVTIPVFYGEEYGNVR